MPKGTSCSGISTKRFRVSLAIQSADRGGDFEVAPRIRSSDDERYAEVARVLDGDSTGVVTLAMSPGTLLIFEGRHSLHRVSPIHGRRLRHVGLLAYDTRRGQWEAISCEWTVTDDRAFDEPPSQWPA